ncbi:MAG: lauroyl acyltransferase [Alphaproteobacteria bacterium]|nr:lauroyl acyltransferase [Alphaproteobacteria bacterium]
MLRGLQNIVEYIIVWSFFQLVGLLPPVTASRFGGWLGRTLGPYIKRTKMAERLMAQHLPELSETQRSDAVTAMWDNMGRILCEYPHLARGALDRFITIEGGEHIQNMIASNAPSMIVSGHIGNWEILPKAAALSGLKGHIVYRPPNNPFIDRLIDKQRRSYSLGHYGKGKEGARGTLRAISRGESFLMLVDQKDNDGALLPFLNAPAMTMTSAAKLAIKHKLHIVMARSIREHGHHHRVIYYPPITLPEGDDEAAMLALTQQFNDIIGSWVRDIPSQWFWLHRRWPK